MFDIKLTVFRSDILSGMEAAPDPWAGPNFLFWVRNQRKCGPSVMSASKWLEGESLGIIGNNGAGKSTLLKLLARISAPTSGEIKIRGRLSALVEVGSGFSPELTGRENIFLNGSMLE